MKNIVIAIVVYLLAMAVWLSFVAATLAVINRMRPPQKPVYRMINIGQAPAIPWRGRQADA
ncbi:MAG: hypothetical protein HND41_11220 [Chlorobi bacterium]|nr:hypothetical protein [Chlorobiota bacterium]